MGVKSSVGQRMVEPDNRTIVNMVSGEVIPRKWAFHLAVGTKWLGLVLDNKKVVFILVRVQSNLLLLASSGKHVWVGMKVATVGVQMTQTDSRAKRNISRDIVHRLGVQGRLELRRHEAITISWVYQAQEMNSEHSAVESDGYNDQTENTGEEMFKPKTLYNMSSASVMSKVYRKRDSYRSDVFGVSEEHPQLENCEGTNPSNREKPNPFNAYCRA